MTDHNDPRIDGDLLISRIVDGEAADGDWNTFRSMAEREPSLWRELAEYQRDQSELSAVVASAIRIADGVEAPVDEEMGRRFSDRTRLIGTWGGWAAAAAVAVVWFTGGLNNREPSAPSNAAGLVNLDKLKPQDVVDNYVKEGKITPQYLYDSYLDAGKETGRVVGEVPDRVLITARPMKAGGGFEVIYVRQIMERARVKELSRFGTAHDEFGNPISVPFEIGPASDPARY